MKKVESLGLSENTLFVFCSDNGPVMDDGYVDEALEKLGDHDASGPFRGGKYSVYEGGTRTPFITSWQGRIPAGESEAIVSTIDLAASLASLNDTELPDDAVVDSFDVMDAMLGVPDAPGRSSMIQQDNNGKSMGFREGKWKLEHHPDGKAKHIEPEVGLSRSDAPEYQLFDLEKDPQETTDVLAENKDIAENMKARLEVIIKAGRHRP